MTIRDNWILFKEALKPRIYQNPFFNGSELTKEIIKSLKLKNVQRVFYGNPNTLVIITKGQIIRIPLDEFSLQRCQNNKQILHELKNTSIASFVPKFIKEGTINDQIYFIESKLSGIAIDVPISKMDYMVEKAADFITQFHKETAKEIEINAECFNKLMSSDLVLLASFISPEYANKLRQIESKLKTQLLGKKIKTVWMHGDYKAENVLFNILNWEISGVIDWDLSNKKGLPLFDILYLLIYKSTLMEKQSVTNILKARYLPLQFKDQEREIIQKYIEYVNLPCEIIEPLLWMFWIHHVTQRCKQAVMSNLPSKGKWLDDNIYQVLN